MFNDFSDKLLIIKLISCHMHFKIISAFKTGRTQATDELQIYMTSFNMLYHIIFQFPAIITNTTRPHSSPHVISIH